MKVSDEIRNWCEFEDGTECGGFVTKASFNKLLALVDRIDGEMVELPQSADGKIWTGREVCFWTGATEGDRHEFNSLTYINGRWCVEDKHWQRYPAESVWYERPDSWERIADDLDEMVDSKHTEDDMCEKLAGIADRIRRLATKKGD